MNLDFGAVLSRAWQLTWNHKVLWIYGFLQTMTGFLLLPLGIIPAFAPLMAGQAGGITNEPWFFILFIAGFVILLLAMYPLSVLLQGALTVGVLRAEQGEEKLAFMGLIRESLPFFRRLLGLMLLFSGGIILVMLIFFVLQSIVSIVTLGLGAMCMAPLSLLTYPLFFVWYACLEQAMAAIVADQMNVMDAAKQGWEVFRNNMGDVGVIGLVLYFGSSLIGGIAILPVVAPLFVIPFAFAVEEFNRTILLLAGVCAAIYLPLFAMFQGAVMAFMKSGWVLTYLRLRRSPKLQPLLQEAAL